MSLSFLSGEAMTYSKLFSPPSTHRIELGREVTQLPAADKRGEIYFFSEKLILAINVALVTGRPLLLAGPPGSGKSTLAKHVAHLLNWRYYQETITTQTRAQDLLYHLDLLKRLYDANAPREGSNRSVDDWNQYVRPGVLWWAFDPDSAAIFAPKSVTEKKRDTRLENRLTLPYKGRNGKDSMEFPPPAVVLIDEIDKADPDVPNNLLQALGRLEFDVPESETHPCIAVDASRAPLIIITTNEERSLPDAFVRRCVVFRLNTPHRDALLILAEEYFGAEFGVKGTFTKAQHQLCGKLGDDFEHLREKATGRKPSTAEFLDAVEVCLHWGLNAESPELEQILSATVEKNLDPDLNATGEA